MEELIIDMAKSIATHGKWGVIGSILLLILLSYLKIKAKKVARRASDERQQRNIAHNQRENSSADEDAQSAEDEIDNLIKRG